MILIMMNAKKKGERFHIVSKNHIQIDTMKTRQSSKDSYALILLPMCKGIHLIRLTDNFEPVTLGRGPKTGIGHIGISKKICSIRINSEGKVYIRMLPSKPNKEHCFLKNGERIKEDIYSDIFIRKYDILTLDSNVEEYKYKVHIINSHYFGTEKDPSTINLDEAAVFTGNILL